MRVKTVLYASRYSPVGNSPSCVSTPASIIHILSAPSEIGVAAARVFRTFCPDEASDQAQMRASTPHANHETREAGVNADQKGIVAETSIMVRTIFKW